MPVSQLLAVIAQRQPCQVAQGQLQQIKAASRDAAMDISQPTSQESPALLLLHGPSLVPEVLNIFKLQCPTDLPLFLSLGSLLCKISHPT